MGKKRKVDVTKANGANKNGEVTIDSKDKMSPPATKKKKNQKEYDSDNESGKYLCCFYWELSKCIFSFSLENYFHAVTATYSELRDLDPWYSSLCQIMFA